MIIKILGTGCKSCERLERATRQALTDLALEGIAIEKVTDPMEIARFGVMRTPALVVDGQVVVAERVPTSAELQALLSAAKV